ncbi:MAG: IMPACT family protein [candidate division Zixibacteria bacterium]|nr:IMPACT family protein [candidate division Zixibacteria bacterium]MDH3937287.1 IMPACT family protein [candidate division Zixibacteria bacterium]MDH4035321.1 IMPACT family protein [candidate division Zixibacteria bacterium]
MDDVYYTIQQSAKTEIKRKGSRFIGEALLVEGVAQATEKLEQIRKREHAATHHCYAWRVGLESEVRFKYSDDGEPGGSAGRPIYDVVCGHQLTNSLLVVTRYYGGTKLGTGGLVRAYGDAATATLDKAGRLERFVLCGIKVRIDFGLYDRLAKLIHSHDARQSSADFSDRVTLELQVRQSRVDVLINDIVQLSSGKATIEKLS